MTQYFSGITRTIPLDKSEWGGCLACGATPCLISLLLKLTPERWLTKVSVDRLVDENKAVENNRILKIYNDTAKIKVGGKKKSAGIDDDFANFK